MVKQTDRQVLDIEQDIEMCHSNENDERTNEKLKFQSQAELANGQKPGKCAHPKANVEQEKQFSIGSYHSSEESFPLRRKNDYDILDVKWGSIKSTMSISSQSGDVQATTSSQSPKADKPIVDLSSTVPISIVDYTNLIEETPTDVKMADCTEVAVNESEAYGSPKFAEELIKSPASITSFEEAKLIESYCAESIEATWLENRATEIYGPNPQLINRLPIYVAQNHIQNLELEIKDLKLERDTYKSMHAYSSSASYHHSRMFAILDRKLDDSQRSRLDDVYKIIPEPLVLQRQREATWIGGSWLSVSRQRPYHVLGIPETHFHRREYELASFVLAKILLNNDLESKPGLIVYVKCLRACILRATGDCRASVYALENALDIAYDFRLLNVVGTVQVHRGLSYLYLKEYAKAAWCFSLARGIAYGYEEFSDMQFQVAERKRMQLPIGHEDRVIPVGFR